MYLNKTFEGRIEQIDYVDKEDLNLVNHLSGLTQKYLKLSFRNVSELVEMRNELMPLIKKNKEEREQLQHDWHGEERE